MIVTQQMPKHFQTSGPELTSDGTEKTTETMRKIAVIKMADFFVEFSDAIMDVDSLAYFNAIILIKKRTMR